LGGLLADYISEVGAEDGHHIGVFGDLLDLGLNAFEALLVASEYERLCHPRIDGVVVALDVFGQFLVPHPHHEVKHQLSNVLAQPFIIWFNIHHLDQSQYLLPLLVLIFFVLEDATALHDVFDYLESIDQFWRRLIEVEVSEFFIKDLLGELAAYLPHHDFDLSV